MRQHYIERFMRYAKLNTRSDANSSTIPSTAAQWDFVLMLKDELEEIGCVDVFTNPENGFVMGTLKGNVEGTVSPIGFISHVDTADFNSENIQPQLIENYDGKAIVLDASTQTSLDPQVFPNLKNYVGHTLITTDGTTLLGADDKAGITAIMEALRFLNDNPHLKHGDVRVAFGPDEEIGVGANRFDAKAFNTDFAYTVDGSYIGQIEYECFNAAAAVVKITGISVHPGTAKDKMINAFKLAMEFDAHLPQDEVPEKTSGREGFFLCTSMTSSIEDATMHYIIRDHDKELFLKKKEKMIEVKELLQKKYPNAKIEVTLKDSYYNMADRIKEDMRSVELAKEAMQLLNIKPIIEPIRGGTDGSKITFMGINTPNLFTGAENFHGKYEFLSIDDGLKCVQTIVNIITLHAQK
ncbi:MAG: peptidase T [Erysipelothrix sp.]|nr:peptidase T [Erysipelothrix sp.]